MTREDVKNIHFLDDTSWADFAESDRVSLLFFMSGGHLECRRQIPAVIDFAQRYGDRFNVCVLDIARSRQAARCCDVRDLPTTVVARKGVFMGGRRGGLDEGSEAQLLEALENIQGLDMSAYLGDCGNKVAAAMA